MPNIDYSRVLSSLIAGERPHVAGVVDVSDLDSLELLTAAGAVNEMFHLHETGLEECLLRYRSLAEWAEIVATARRKYEERITFRTSGSRGVPKPCTHAMADLETESEEHAQLFEGCERVYTLVPAHHIYGFLFTVLLPARLKAAVIDARLWSPSRLARSLRNTDLLVATPTHWDYLRRSQPHFPVPAQGLTSTAPCPEALYRGLLQSGLRLTEIYGSSETAGIGYRRSPDCPFELFSFRKEAPPEAELMDYLVWVSTRHFRVLGRRDHAVQVGGTNVYPDHIADRICRHPEVARCAVRLMRPEEGDRLKAYIVWKTTADPTGLERWMRREFRPHERPAELVYGTDLPRNELGKLQDWE